MKREIEEYYCKLDPKLDEYKHYFSDGIVEDIPSKIFLEKRFVSLREFATFRMGFSVVTKKNCIYLARIIGGEKVLEVMCGLGAYSATLRDCGVDVIATDDMSWIEGDEKKYRDWKVNSWVSDIIKIDAVDAVRKYGGEVGFVLMSWPPQHDEIAHNVLLTMRGINPNCKMIYIGEWKGGCTAEEKFFEDAVDISNEIEGIKELRNSYHVWENDGYFDKQFILI
ncbi:MAG: hypothetical protein K6G27_13835 [Lachnospiraceae bacterium]|nr:hypothetical protein [Lachnospiraceae bacterium]